MTCERRRDGAMVHRTTPLVYESQRGTVFVGHTCSCNEVYTQNGRHDPGPPLRRLTKAHAARVAVMAEGLADG